MRSLGHGLSFSTSMPRSPRPPFLVVVVLASLAGQALALVNIPDMKEVEGVWTAANSPYVIHGRAIIPPGATLTIKSGVEVRFKTGNNFDFTDPGFDPGMLIVQGQLKALGQPNDFIQFTRDGNVGRWGVVYFKDNDPSIIQCCKFSYSWRVWNLPNNIGGKRTFQGALSFAKDSGCDVTSCVFAENFWGVDTYRAAWAFEGCHFVDNITGGVIASYCNPQISSSLFERSKTGIRCEYFSSPTIDTNRIFDVSVGVDCYYKCNPFLHNNEVSAANFCVLAMRSCHPVVKNCILTDANHGVCIETESACDVWNTTLYDNGKGVDIWDNSTATVLNSIIWGCGADFGFMGAGNSATVKYSSLQNAVQPPQVALGVGNLFGQNPWFRDPNGGDFHLQASQCGDPHNSPCIDRGNPEAAAKDACLGCETGLWSRRNDMGAYGGPLNCWLPLPQGRFESPSDCSGLVSSVHETPVVTGLWMNCSPNPFSDEITVRLSLPVTATGYLRVYDLNGRVIRTLYKGTLQGAQAQAFSWDGTSDSGMKAARGLFVLVLDMGGLRLSRPIMFTD